MNGEGTTPERGAPLEDAARMELAMAAASAERANRPRGLVIVASLLLVAAAVYAWAGWSARGAAVARVEGARQDARRIVELATQVRNLREVQIARGVAPGMFIARAIETAAAQAGVTKDASGTELVVSDTEAPATGIVGITQRKYSAKVTGQDPGALLAWLVSVQNSPETRGVEINLLTLQPDIGANEGAWSLTVDFVRWEKK